MTDTPNHLDALEGDAPGIVTALPSFPADVQSAIPDAQSPAPKSNSVSASDMSGEKDANGDVWNPELHQSDKTKTRKGVWKKKKGRKTGAAPQKPQLNVNSVIGGQTQQPQQPNALVASPPPMDNKIAARQIAHLLEAGAVAFGGKDFAFKKSRDLCERSEMESAFTGYFDHKGGAVNLPPELGLVAAIMVWAAPRFRESPEVQKRVKSRWAAITGFFKKRSRSRPNRENAKRTAKAETKAPESKDTKNPVKPDSLGTVHPDFAGLV